MSDKYFKLLKDSQRPLKPKDRLILLLLADAATYDGRVYPILSDLAHQANCSRKAASRSLKRLISREALVKIDANGYRVKFDA